VKVLLTGGTGFLGKSVAHHLHAHAHELRLLVRTSSDLSGLPKGIEIARGDVTDLEGMKRAAEGCGAIVHLAALVKSWQPRRESFSEVNVGGLKNALAAAQSAGARLLYTSSFMAVGPAGPEPADEAYARPRLAYHNDYERTKVEADLLARRAASLNQDVVILYPGVVYGPGNLTDGNLVVRMVADHLEGRLPGIIGPGDRVWSYAFVEDVAEAHVAALERAPAGSRYFLSGDTVSMNRLFEILDEVAGVAPPSRHIPYGLAWVLGYSMFLWAELTGLPPLLTQEVVSVFRRHWAYSSAKAEAELSYRRTSLREGLRLTVGWLRERAPEDPVMETTWP